MSTVKPLMEQFKELARELTYTPHVVLSFNSWEDARLWRRRLYEAVRTGAIPPLMTRFIDSTTIAVALSPGKQRRSIKFTKTPLAPEQLSDAERRAKEVVKRLTEAEDHEGDDDTDPFEILKGGVQ